MPSRLPDLLGSECLTALAVVRDLCSGLLAEQESPAPAGEEAESEPVNALQRSQMLSALQSLAYD